DSGRRPLPVPPSPRAPFAACGFFPPPTPGAGVTSAGFISARRAPSGAPPGDFEASGFCAGALTDSDGPGFDGFAGRIAGWGGSGGFASTRGSGFGACIGGSGFAATGGGFGAGAGFTSATGAGGFGSATGSGGFGVSGGFGLAGRVARGPRWAGRGGAVGPA